MNNVRVPLESAREFVANSKKRLGHLVRREDGTVTFLGVSIFMMILMVGGVGVDLMYFEQNRTKLQNILDTAVLAAADMEQELDPESVVRNYFALAGMSNFLNAVHVEEDEFHRQVSADVSVGITTMLMHLVGIETLSSTVSSAAVEKTPDVEISMVLDISGSMATNDRAGLMKKAAKAFSERVLSRNVNSAGRVNPSQTSLNIIPYSGQTNPGEAMFEYLGGVRFGGVSNTEETDYFPEWSQDISNIVFRFDRDGDGEIDYSVKIEDYPDNDVEMFNKDDLDTYYSYAIEYIASVDPNITAGSDMWVGATIKGGLEPTSYFSTQEEGMGDPAPDDGPTKFNGVDLTIDFSTFYNGIVPNNTSSCLEMTHEDFTSIGLPSGTPEQVPYFVNWDFDEVTQNWGWCPEDEMAIQYAQNDVEAINSFIDNLRLFDGTGTNYGMKYALALLDPNSQPAFQHLSSLGEIPAENAQRPLGWRSADSSKFIVLLTDGRTSTQYRPADILDLENDDVELSVRPLEERVSASSSWTNNELLLYQCELAKKKGVIVYTVALETDEVAAAEVKKCASSPAHFFEVTGEEVIDSFVAISSSIQRLRLVY